LVRILSVVILLECEQVAGCARLLKIPIRRTNKSISLLRCQFPDDGLDLDSVPNIYIYIYIYIYSFTEEKKNSKMLSMNVSHRLLSFISSLRSLLPVVLPSRFPPRKISWKNERDAAFLFGSTCVKISFVTVKRFSPGDVKPIMCRTVHKTRRFTPRRRAESAVATGMIQ